MNKTKIEWCDVTWNPVTGCYHTCPYCYARKMARRFSGVKIKNGNGLLFELDEPYVSQDGVKRPYPYEFCPTFHKYRLDEIQNKKGCNVFVCSMADLFGGWVPDAWIDAVFDACRAAPQHRYLFLTKNPARYWELDASGKLPEAKNFWFGTSVTTPDDSWFYSRNHNTFWSVEPMLRRFEKTTVSRDKLVDWVIIGAETGTRRGMVTPRPGWIYELADEVGKYHVPLFYKDSLKQIVGEVNMRREFPWEVVEDENYQTGL